MGFWYFFPLFEMGVRLPVVMGINSTGKPKQETWLNDTQRSNPVRLFMTIIVYRYLVKFSSNIESS